MQQLTPEQVKALLDLAARGEVPTPVLVDVREPWEFEVCRLDGSLSMPMRSVPARCNELDKDDPTVVICHHGTRSAQVGMFLEQQGFSNVINLQGGVAAWAARIDAAMPTY